MFDKTQEPVKMKLKLYFQSSGNKSTYITSRMSERSYQQDFRLETILHMIEHKLLFQ